MKIILKENVKDLGKAGDLVDAKSGFARNFLFPRGLAVEATPQNMKEWEAEQKLLKAEQKAELEEAEKVKKQIEGSTVTLIGKAGDGGKLFGSVTSQDIAKALKEQYGIEIDKRKIDMGDNIKDLGVTVVKVKVYPEITADLKVNVKAKN